MVKINHPTPQTKLNRTKNSLSWKKIVIFIGLLFSMFLIFNNNIKKATVNHTSNKHDIAQMTLKQIQANQKKPTTFDFDKVNELNVKDVLASATLHDSKKLLIGQISIPAIGINIGINKGVSNYVLSIGAGTMKENQVMGQGNYALAGHNYPNTELLFSPLIRKAKTGQDIFITDLENIYIYKIYRLDYVKARQSDVIDDVKDKKLITLVTCTDTGRGRFIVQGELINTIKNKDADKQTLSYFHL